MNFRIIRKMIGDSCMNKYVLIALTVLASSTIAMDYNWRNDHRMGGVNHNGQPRTLAVMDITGNEPVALLITAMAAEFAQDRSPVPLLDRFISQREQNFEANDYKVAYFKRWQQKYAEVQSRMLLMPRAFWVHPPAFNGLGDVGYLQPQQDYLNVVRDNAHLSVVIAHVAYQYTLGAGQFGLQHLQTYIGHMPEEHQMLYAITWNEALNHDQRWVDPQELSAEIWGVPELREQPKPRPLLMPQPRDLVAEVRMVNNHNGINIVPQPEREPEPELQPDPLPREIQQLVSKIKGHLSHGNFGPAFMALNPLCNNPKLTVAQKILLLEDLKKGITNSDTLKNLNTKIETLKLQLSASPKGPQQSPAKSSSVVVTNNSSPVQLPSAVISSPSKTSAEERSALLSSTILKWQPNSRQVEKATEIIKTDKIEQEAIKKFVTQLYINDESATILFKLVSRIPEAKTALKKFVATEEKDFTAEDAIAIIMKKFAISDSEAVQIFSYIPTFKPLAAQASRAGELLQGKKNITGDEAEKLLMHELTIDIDTAQAILGNLYFWDGASIGLFEYEDQEPDEKK
jgi:hypothetical protein